MEGVGGGGWKEWDGWDPGDVRYNIIYILCVLAWCYAASYMWARPKTSGTLPGARDGHSAAVLDSSIYIFGGYEQLVGFGSRPLEIAYDGVII